MSRIKDYLGEIELILFDRGFYDKDLMFELDKLNYPYLIFVPKHQDKKSILYPMKTGSEIAIHNEFKVNKGKSNFVDENILIFLKQIYDPRSEKSYDWVFATNIEEVLLENLVVTKNDGELKPDSEFRTRHRLNVKAKI